MHTEYIRLPPDSTGKRIRHLNRTDLKLSSFSINLNTLDRGSILTGETSNATGEIVGWSTDLDSTFIHVTDVNGSFSDGEDISVNSSVIGTLESATTVYTPAINIVDSDNPNNRQKIDKRGSSYVRFTDGDMLFDAFGNAQFSQNSVVDYHTFLYGFQNERYYQLTGSGGSISGQPEQSSVILSTNTTSGSRAIFSTNRYYPYTPGIGSEMIVSFRLGDSGKQNVIRRWGMFDDEDGVFFEMSGSVFSAGIRNSSTGTVTDTKIISSNFNGDSLDDPETSEFLIDFTKYNIYFIDYQWLGAGRVRFGVYSPSGKRIVIHTFENPNANIVPYMRRGTLPFRVEQINYAATISTSEMSLLCASIQKQNNDPEYKGTFYFTISQRVYITGSSYTPLISLKPVATFNGETNKITAFFVDYETDVSGSGIILSAFVGATLSGSTFTQTTSSFSAFQVDTSATSMTGGINRGSVFCPSGTSRRELRENFDNSAGTLANGATPTATFAAKTIDPSGSAYVTLISRWKEVR